MTVPSSALVFPNMKLLLELLAKLLLAAISRLVIIHTRLVARRRGQRLVLDRIVLVVIAADLSSCGRGGGAFACGARVGGTAVVDLVCGARVDGCRGALSVSWGGGGVLGWRGGG